MGTYPSGNDHKSRRNAQKSTERAVQILQITVTVLRSRYGTSIIFRSVAATISMILALVSMSTINVQQFNKKNPGTSNYFTMDYSGHLFKVGIGFVGVRWSSLETFFVSRPTWNYSLRVPAMIPLPGVSAPPVTIFCPRQRANTKSLLPFPSSK